MGGACRFKNFKRNAYFKPSGMRVNCDGTTVKDRKPNMLVKPNHHQFMPRIHRIWNSHVQGQALSDGYGWFRRVE